MDPNATLAILRATIAEYRATADALEAGSVSWKAAQEELVDLGDTLAESADALDQWLTKSGAIPGAWGGRWTEEG